MDMIVRNVLVLFLAYGCLVVPEAAAQSGRRTLENLFDPVPEEADDRRPAAAPSPAKRLPVPPQVAVDEATALIHQAYEETIKDAASNPLPAIRTFRDTAEKTADAGRKYALLALAEQLALDAGSTSQALEIVARRATLFDIDPLTARHALLAKIARADDVRPDATLFAHIVETARLATEAEQFDLADAAADLAASTAKTIEREEKLRAAESRRRREPAPVAIGGGLNAEAAQLQKAVRERRRQAFDFTAARDTLAASPDDAAAAEVVGRYLCLVKNDWRAGLPALAKGNHEGLRDLAGREIAMEKGTAATARLALANGWWKLAEEGQDLSPPQTDAVRSHAAAIYRDIVARLSDPIDVALARKRAKLADEDVETPAAAFEPAFPTLDTLPGGGR